MKTVLMADPVRYPRMTTDELRDTFLLSALCEPGKLHLNYVDLDRAVVGFAAPVTRPIALPTDPELRANYFTERRELGALNIGGAGIITVEGKSYELNNLDVLYIGRGNKQVTFASKDKDAPAVFYLLSYPAHAEYPVALVRKEDANPTELGIAGDLQQAHHLQVHPSRGRAQLSAGHGRYPSCARQQLEHHAAAYPHAPLRNLHVLQSRPDARVFHLMGPPDETRHLVMADKDVVISPGWSIHCRRGHARLQLLLGHGRRKPGLRRHGSRPGRNPAVRERGIRTPTQTKGGDSP